LVNRHMRLSSLQVLWLVLINQLTLLSLPILANSHVDDLLKNEPFIE
jgi:hypothetical protein